MGKLGIWVDGILAQIPVSSGPSRSEKTFYGYFISSWLNSRNKYIQQLTESLHGPTSVGSYGKKGHERVMEISHYHLNKSKSMPNPLEELGRLVAPSNS